MSTPWRKLKDIEIAILARRRTGKPYLEAEWQRLHKLFEQCRTADDAEDAVCFHGVVALLAEHKGEFGLALKHRMIEIEKIVWLHEEEKRNPTDGYQTQDYGNAELEYRREIVRTLQSQM